MEVFDHLYDDDHTNFYEPTEQGRTKEQVQKTELALFWLFATSFALILACSIYLCLSALLN